MLEVSKNNREQIEREFIALVLNKNDVINLLQIKPKYFINQELAKILEYSIECFKEHNIVIPTEIGKKHNDFNIDLCINIMLNEIWYQSAWKQQLDYSQESILKYYKEDFIKDMNKKLEQHEMTYEEFTKNIKAIEKITIKNTNNNRMKTIKDIDTQNQEIKTYIKSNSIELDKKIHGFIIGELSVWSGGNASAKSTYLNQLAIESIEQDNNVAIFSGELTDKRLLNWLTMQSAGKKNMSYNHEKDYWFVNSYAKETILKWLNNKLFIYDNDYGNNAHEIIETLKDTITKNNVKVIILDNLMSVDLDSYGDSKYDVQKKFISDLSELAKKYNVHIHFVAHPRKTTTFLRKVDISGTADLTNIADNVFIMHRVNNDFKLRTKEMFKWSESNPIYTYPPKVKETIGWDYEILDDNNVKIVFYKWHGVFPVISSLLIFISI